MPTLPGILTHPKPRVPFVLPDLPREWTSEDPPSSFHPVTVKGHAVAEQELPPPVVVGGVSFQGGPLAVHDNRYIAERHKQTVAVRARALEGTSVEFDTDAASILSRITKRNDDPLKSPAAAGALGWLLRLETKDPALRMLAVNRRAMTSLATLYLEVPLSCPFERYPRAAVPPAPHICYMRLRALTRAPSRTRAADGRSKVGPQSVARARRRPRALPPRG